jgi:sec-independent protein translocase protein TatA
MLLLNGTIPKEGITEEGKSMLPTSFAFLDLGTPELLIILVIVLLLFGGKKLPQLSKALGESMRELRKGINGDTHEEKTTTKEGTDKSEDNQ